MKNSAPFTAFERLEKLRREMNGEVEDVSLTFLGVMLLPYFAWVWTDRVFFFPCSSCSRVWTST